MLQRPSTKNQIGEESSFSNIFDDTEIFYSNLTHTQQFQQNLMQSQKKWYVNFFFLKKRSLTSLQMNNKT